MPHSVDIVVVGGGLSGLETASALKEAGARVVVVDSAPAEGVDNTPTRHLTWSSTRPPHYAAPSVSTARLGGRSLYWRGVVLRLEPWTLNDRLWPRDVSDALTDAGGLYDQVESDLIDFCGSCLAAPRREGDEHLVNVLAGLSLGHATYVPQAARIFPGAQLDFYTPLTRWVAMGGRAQTRCGSYVVDVTANSRGVTGVRLAARGRPGTTKIACSTVVLAAGTIENTRLAAQLIGRSEGFCGLRDHLVQGFVTTMPAAALHMRGHREAFAMLHGDYQRRNNMFVRTRALPDPEKLLLDAWTMGEQKGSDVSSIAFSHLNELPWQVAVSAGLCETDLFVLAQGRNWLQQLATGLNLSSPVFEPDPFAKPCAPSDAYEMELSGRRTQLVTYNWPLGAANHESGTLPFGTILDERSMLREAPGAYVVGPAIFPRCGAANPSLTTLALARLTARTISAGSRP